MYCTSFVDVEIGVNCTCPGGGVWGQWASISLIEDNFSHTYPDTHIESQDKFATKSRSKQLNCT